MAKLKVAIVGAGIVGASCARTLTAGGAEVVVIEREESPAMGSTGKSAAGVRAQFSTPANVEMSLRSQAWYQSNDSGYDPLGYLFLVTEDLWEQQQRYVDMQRSLGAEVQTLTLEQAQDHITFDPKGLGGATFGPNDGIVDPHTATLTMLREARANGATLMRGTLIDGVEQHGDGWMLASGEQRIEADIVVNAAGAWSTGLAALAGMELPIRPHRETIFVTGPKQRPKRIPMTMDFASGLWLRSEADRLLVGGHYLGGSGAPDLGFVEGVEWSLLDDLIVAAERYPWFADEQLDDRASWWGYYAITPDHNPILGRNAAMPSWVNACGFSGHGVMHAPATGDVIAEEILQGEATLVDMRPFRLERFDGTESLGESNVF